MTDEISELKLAVEKAQQAAREATEKLGSAKYAESLARMQPLKDLVGRAHNALCQWNHTDGCSWGYEDGSKDPWECSEHSRWLSYYDRIVHGDGNNKPRCTVVEVEHIISAVEELKPKVKTALSLLRGGLIP
jgi:hypothetical protein